ncbi:hypothetical protein D3C81_2030330 [compost metagenome]
MRHFDDGHTAQDITRIATLVAGVAPARDQALGLIEMNGGDRDATACGDFTDRHFHMQVFFIDFFHHSA